MPEEPKNQSSPEQTQWNDAPSPSETPTISSDTDSAPQAEPLLTTQDEPPKTEVEPLQETTVPSEESQPVPDPAAPTTTLTPVGEASTTEVQPVAVAAPAGKSKKPLIIGGIIAAALALLIGAGAFAYAFWYQNPNKVVTDAIINAVTAKTVSATGTVDMTAEDYRIKIEASGKNSAQAHSQMAVKLTYTTDDVSFTVDGEAVLSGSGDMYVKLNDAQQLADSITEQSGGQLDLAVFGEVITKIDGQWIKIGSDDLGTFSEEYASTQRCVADISKQLDEDAAFVKTVENEIKTLYSNNQFIIVGESLGSKTINGQGSLGYELSADSEKADAFFTGFEETALGQRLEDCDESLSFADIVGEELNEESTETTTTELWVSRFGHEITELRIESQEDGTTGVAVLNPVFNKKQAVDVPANAIPLAELQADIERALGESFVSDESMMSVDDADIEVTTEFN